MYKYPSKQGYLMQTAPQRLQKHEEQPQSNEAIELDPEIIKLASTTMILPQSEQENQYNALKEINTALLRLRLSKNEVKIYLFLARQGAQKAQRIAESLGLPRTEAYKVLRELENKGIIFRILERPMKFMVVPFEKILEEDIEERRQKILKLEKKKDELLHLWQTLPKACNTEDVKESLQIIEGKRQISARIAQILGETNRKIRVVVSDRHLVWLFNSTFFEELNEKGEVEAKILTDYSQTSTFVIEQVVIPSCDFAFLRTKGQPSFVVSDIGTLILIMEDSDEKFSAMETNYASMLSSYSSLFDLLWKNQSHVEH
ncbi:MAG: helix-turn-helix domain-containing protein [Candidatus Bathyarchaeia archaeon]|jgi:sugar-specific transcriptional regulator TrmB